MAIKCSKLTGKYEGKILTSGDESWKAIFELRFQDQGEMTGKGTIQNDSGEGGKVKEKVQLSGSISVDEEQLRGKMYCKSFGGVSWALKLEVYFDEKKLQGEAVYYPRKEPGTDPDEDGGDVGQIQLSWTEPI